MTDYSKKNNLKVNLENFQSISNASLEFVQGINIIVGQSNSGKSAILRAIKGAVLNPNGSQKYIKNKTKGFKVGIEYEGNSIEWSRGTKSPKYVINGEEYQKVGNSNLTDILDNSGFVLDENKTLMNIESELELPFPFDKSNAELFKLFEKNIFCVSDSTAVTQLIKADEAEVTRQKENAEYELSRFKEKLQAVEDFEKEVDMNKLVEGRNKLSNAISNSEKLSLDISKLSDMIEVGYTLSKEIPEVNVNSSIQHDYSALSSDLSKLAEIKQLGHILQTKLECEPNIVDISNYTELYDSVQQLEHAEKLVSILRALEAPTTRDINDEYTSLRNDINTLSSLSEQAQNKRKELEEIKAKIQELETEKNSFKVCPLCGGELGE